MAAHMATRTRTNALSASSKRCPTSSLERLPNHENFVKRKIVVIGANQVHGEAGEWATPVWTQQACH